jgi:hypothetical protein
MLTRAEPTLSLETATERERRLRLLTFGLLAIQALYWAYTMWLGMRRADDYRGYQWMAAFFSTPGFLTFTVPGLLLYLTGVLRRFAFVWACIGLIIVPLVLWGTIAASLMDAVSGR